MQKRFEAAKTYDARGELCPLPVIHATKTIKDLKPGEILELLADDPNSVQDVKVWVNKTGHELLEFLEEQTDGSKSFRFFIKKHVFSAG